MANTFTQIHIHTLFAVQGRQSLISRNINWGALGGNGQQSKAYIQEQLGIRR